VQFYAPADLELNGPGVLVPQERSWCPCVVVKARWERNELRPQRSCGQRASLALITGCSSASAERRSGARTLVCGSPLRARHEARLHDVLAALKAPRGCEGFSRFRERTLRMRTLSPIARAAVELSLRITYRFATRHGHHARQQHGPAIRYAGLAPCSPKEAPSRP
jgi:hypothetical protein